MDFMITHGSAFGGCAAICPDGRIRRDKVALDNILMYGKHPSGKEFTYYIEDQGLEICACDNPICIFPVAADHSAASTERLRPPPLMPQSQARLP